MGTHFIGTGAVGRVRKTLTKPINVVAKHHRKVKDHLLPSPFYSRVGIRTVYSQLLLFTKHNLAKILMIFDHPDP